MKRFPLFQYPVLYFFSGRLHIHDLDGHPTVYLFQVGVLLTYTPHRYLTGSGSIVFHWVTALDREALRGWNSRRDCASLCASFRKLSGVLFVFFCICIIGAATLFNSTCASLCGPWRRQFNDIFDEEWQDRLC